MNVIIFSSGFDPENADSCSSGGATLCHSRARCTDDTSSSSSSSSGGFCCACHAGFYGDGRTCLPSGRPQRVGGKVSGSVNSVSFRDQDLYSYVVPEDGRIYTALSRVPPAIGTEMQVGA